MSRHTVHLVDSDLVIYFIFYGQCGCSDDTVCHNDPSLSGMSEALVSHENVQVYKKYIYIHTKSRNKVVSKTSKILK